SEGILTFPVSASNSAPVGQTTIVSFGIQCKNYEIHPSYLNLSFFIGLNPPTNLSTNSYSPYNSVILKWQDNSNYESDYEIWRKGINENWHSIYQYPTQGQGTGQVTWTDNSVSKFRDYFYKVRKYRDRVYSKYSESDLTEMCQIFFEKYMMQRLGLKANNKIKDTVPHKNKKNWKIGTVYLYGFIRGGEATARRYPDITFDILYLLFIHYTYSLNAIGPYLFYSINKKYEIGIEAQYLWTKLNERRGYNGMTHDYTIYVKRVAFMMRYNGIFRWGIPFYLSKTIDDFYDWGLHRRVTRWGRGFGLFFGLESKKVFSPLLKIEFGVTREYKNDSPWYEKHKLIISLAGIYLGIKLEIGGIR
ncbi:MAG: hypothetical protein QXM39_04885, partial [Thermoplasmata archaeon]